MGCGSCGSGGGCSSAGCGQKGGCATGGCNKLNSFDWLGNMLTPDKSEADNIYEVRFKNTRKAFYRNVNGLRLYAGDRVVVESDRGYDVGTLSLGGVVAELQMRKKNASKGAKDIPRIYRKANDNDLELLEQVRSREKETLARSRELIIELKLDMKLSDVEFQGDNAKAIFYYIADHRVDFRELIKVLAREFRIRVEMKQIGLRHEAGLVGGIGSCGRELCCSTWLTEFKTVSTQAARYQNLSLNPMKISGLCGRLKCCLNFELESYLDALKDFPKIEAIDTKKGAAYLQKTDIFKGKMWFSYPGETTWHPMNVMEVKKVVELNKKGEKPESLSILAAKQAVERGVTAELDFVDVVGTVVPKAEPRRRKSSGNRNQRNKPKGRRGGQRGGGQQQNKKNSGGQQTDKKEQEKKQSSGGGPRNQGPQKSNRNSQNRNKRNNKRPRPPQQGNKKRPPRPPRNNPPKDSE